jgi:DNA-binding HxlR family transcriptional regulator
VEHKFDIEHARQYGIEEAVLISNFTFWITHNRANGENFRDGKTWTWNSHKAFAELFPYMTRDSIRRTLEKLEKGGVIVKGQHNPDPKNRTLWYAFADEDQFLPVLSHVAETPNADGENGGTQAAKTPRASGKNAKSLISTDSKRTDRKPDGTAARGTRLSTEWVLTVGWAKEAFETCPHMNDEQVRFEAKQFKDYWTAKSGKDATKRDWLATWRMWIRKAGEGIATNGKPRGGVINRAEAVHENNKRAAADGVRMIEERERLRNGGAAGKPADDGKTIDMDPQ